MDKVCVLLVTGGVDWSMVSEELATAIREERARCARDADNVDKEYYDALGKELIKEGCRIVTVSTANGARGLIATQRLDAVVTELKLPLDVSEWEERLTLSSRGKDLCAEIRRTHPRLPVAVATSVPLDREEVRNLAHMGIKAWETHAVRPSDLATVIRRLVPEPPP